MKNVKMSLTKLAAITALGATLALPTLSFAEDPVAPGTTVNTIPLTTAQISVRDSSGQVVSNQPLDVSSGATPSAPTPIAAPNDAPPAVDAPQDPGLLEKVEDKTKAAYDTTKEKTKSAYGTAKDKTKSAYGTVKDKTKSATHKVVDGTKKVAHNIGDGTKKAAHKVGEEAKDLKDAVKDKFSSDTPTPATAE